MSKNFVERRCKFENCELEDIKLIEEMFSDEIFDFYQELNYPQFYKDFEATSQKLLEIIQTKFDLSIKETILKMCFVHAFTAMEIFFFNALIMLLRRNPEQIDKIKIKEKTTDAENHHSKKMIMTKIAEKSYPKTISKILAIFGIQTENYDKLLKYREIRNDIVHRNGKNKSGKKIKFSRRRLIDCMKEIRFFVDHVEREIQKLNMKSTDATKEQF